MTFSSIVFYSKLKIHNSKLFQAHVRMRKKKTCQLHLDFTFGSYALTKVGVVESVLWNEIDNYFIPKELSLYSVLRSACYRPLNFLQQRCKHLQRNNRRFEHLGK